MNARKSGNERTKIFRAFMSRPSCVHVQTIVRSPDHRAFMSRPSCVHVQTIVRSSVFPDRVILNARHPLRAFISVWTYLVSVWDLSLGTQIHPKTSTRVPLKLFAEKEPESRRAEKNQTGCMNSLLQVSLLMRHFILPERFAKLKIKKLPREILFLVILAL